MPTLKSEIILALSEGGVIKHLSKIDSRKTYIYVIIHYYVITIVTCRPDRPLWYNDHSVMSICILLCFNHIYSIILELLVI